MNKLRSTKKDFIDGSKTVTIKDFDCSKTYDIKNNKVSSLDFPKSNVLIFESEDGSTVAARPSGTEPKIKFYISVNCKLENKEAFDKKNYNLEDKINRIVKEFEF